MTHSEDNKIYPLNEPLKIHLSEVFGDSFFLWDKIDLCLGFEMWLEMTIITNSSSKCLLPVIHLILVQSYNVATFNILIL